MKIWLLYFLVAIVTGVLTWLVAVFTYADDMVQLELIIILVEIVVLPSLFIYRNYPSQKK